jgi:hypothetical protein
MSASETVTTKYTNGQPTPDNVIGAVPVLAVVWCRSVGASWTLELHQLSRGRPPRTLLDWISSGVPISQPEPPAALARELLAERGLRLFRDSSTGPNTHSRRGIGYACQDAELIKLAHLVRDDAAEAGWHPLTLAMHWTAAGFSADAAAQWVRQGIHSPHAAQHQTVSLELTVSPTHTTTTVPSPDRHRNGP